MLNKKIFLGVALVVLFLFLYIYIEELNLKEIFTDLEYLQEKLKSLDAWGPFLIIVLMCGAIVMSPIPSAPIAVASGLVYGHLWGTIYILIGAQLGAIIAFSIARLLGYEAMQKKFGDQIKYKHFNSQKNLMLVVFITRLIPFISFDIISYAAGLTKINFLQFSLATFFGILPASFLLAHFGEKISENNTQQVLMTVLFLGVFTAIPVIYGLVKKFSKV